MIATIGDKKGSAISAIVAIDGFPMSAAIAE